MRLIVLVATLLSLAFTRSGNLIGYVDLPQNNATMSASDPLASVVAGWEFDCTTGDIGAWSDVQITYYGLGARTGMTWTPTIDYNRTTRVNRPDVQVAFAPWCPVLPANGYNIFFTQPPPSGSWHVVVRWLHNYSVHYSQFEITIQ